MPYRPTIGEDSETRGVSLEGLVGRLWLGVMALAILLVTSTSYAASSDCAEVKLPTNDVVLEPYLSAVPRNVLLLPLAYQALPQPYLPDGHVGAYPPPWDDVFTGLELEVTRSGAVVRGDVEGVDLTNETNVGQLATWMPSTPLEPGQHTVRVLPGRFSPDPEETPDIDNSYYCSVRFTPSSASFTVPDESYQDWVDGVELTLREGATGGSTSISCCELAECIDDDLCFQCWDFWSQPALSASWSGTGTSYLSFDVQALTPNLNSGLRFVGFGEYCVQGTVDAPDGSLRSLEACGSLTEEEVEPTEKSPREECRMRVPASSCQALPEGMTDLSELFVVHGSSPEEAEAALIAAPYHALEGCYDPPNPDGGSPPVGLPTPPEPPADSGCGLAPPSRAPFVWSAVLLCTALGFVKRRR